MDEDTLLAIGILGAIVAFVFLSRNPNVETYNMDPNATAPASSLATSQDGQNNIVKWEGWKRNAYKDIAGNWSIGVGHKIVQGDGLSQFSTLTDGQVQQLFMSDLAQAENDLKSYVTVPITQGQFDALIDMFFQFGGPKIGGSTLVAMLNNGDYSGAANEFAKWVHAGNPPVVVEQLVERRGADTAMFV